MSTCSSDFGLSSDDEDDGRPILIPEFIKVEPRTAQVDLSTVPGIDALADDALTPQQLEERVSWCNEIHKQLSLYLQSLTETLHSEWATKESLLEQILEKETGVDWKLP